MRTALFVSMEKAPLALRLAMIAVLVIVGFVAIFGGIHIVVAAVTLAFKAVGVSVAVASPVALLKVL